MRVINRYLRDDEGLVVVVSFYEGGVDVRGVRPHPIRGQNDTVPVKWDYCVALVLGTILVVLRKYCSVRYKVVPRKALAID